MTHTRRDFIRFVPGLGAFAVATPAFGQTPQVRTPSDAGEDIAWPPPAPPRGAPVDDSYPSQHPALAREMVAVSHGNLARVRELVTRWPELAKASWDWGFGDWETALGAASHVGNRAIAELLIDRGAAPTMFSAAMFGQVDVLRALVAARTGIQRLRGPHGLTLMHHARSGGANAQPALEFLQSIGGADEAYHDEPLPAADLDALRGRYRFGDRRRDEFAIDIDGKRLMITRAGATPRGLFHQGDLTFHAAGAPGVTMRFERAAARATAIAVFDPDLVVRALRVP
jgi:hypothetical protein